MDVLFSDFTAIFCFQRLKIEKRQAKRAAIKRVGKKNSEDFKELSFGIVNYNQINSFLFFLVIRGGEKMLSLY